MRDRFSSTLAGTGAPAGAGRKKRSLGQAGSEEEYFDQAVRILRRIAETEEKYKSRD